MDTDQLADHIATTTITMLLIALFVWLIVVFPLWSAIALFAIVGFFAIAFFGTAIAMGSYFLALTIKASLWVIGWIKRRHVRA